MTTKDELKTAQTYADALKTKLDHMDETIEALKAEREKTWNQFAATNREIRDLEIKANHEKPLTPPQRATLIKLGNSFIAGCELCSYTLSGHRRFHIGGETLSGKVIDGLREKGRLTQRSVEFQGRRVWEWQITALGIADLGWSETVNAPLTAKKAE